MKPKLRPIQLAARQKIGEAFRAGHRRILAVAPTGFGKTVVLANVADGHLAKMKEGRALVLVHRHELLAQTRTKLHEAGVEWVGVIGADLSEEPLAPVQVATIQSLLGRERLPSATLVIPDECHHYAAEEWGRVLNAYRDALVIGFTATPMRTDKSSLGDMFQALVVCAQTRELMDLGQLCEIDVYAPERTTKDNSESPLAAYQKRAPGRPAIVFAQSVKQAYELAEEFSAAGYPAACVEGKTDPEQRACDLERFKRGELTVLTNVFVLTEGFDAPRAEVCILARGCQSVGAYLQMVGRVLRPHPDKARATLIDLRGAVHKHGLPDETRIFGLEGNPISTGEAPTKVCPKCQAICHASIPACKACGFVFPGRDRALDIAPVVKIGKKELERSYWTDLLNEAVRNGYRTGWAAHRFHMKHGRFPAKFWKEAVKWRGM